MLGGAAEPWTIQAVADGDGVARAAEAGPPEAVLIDLGHGQDASVVAAVRAAAPEAALVVLAADARGADEARRAGVPDVFDQDAAGPALLEAVLRHAVDARRVAGALQAAREQHRLLLDALPVGVFRSTADGRLLSLNRSGARLLGYDPEDLPATLPDLALAVRRGWTREDDDAVANVRIAVSAGQGAPVWLAVAARSLPHRPGETGTIEGIFQDVTDQHRAELAAQENEERLRAVFDAFPMPAYALRASADGLRIVDRNAAARSGAAAPEILSDPALRSDLERCLRERAVFRRVMSRSAADAPAFTDITCAFVPPDTLLVLLEDITDRWQSDAALRRHARQYAALAVLGRRALATLDVEGLVQYLVTMAPAVLDAHLCAVLDVGGGGRVRVRAAAGWEEGPPDVPRGDAPLALEVAASHEPCAFEDIETTGFRHDVLLRGQQVRSACAVPVAGPGGVAVVLVGHRAPRPFGIDEVHFIQSLAHLLAAALLRAEAESARTSFIERLIAAQDKERRRLARELHDEAGQSLTSLLVGLTAIDQVRTVRRAREIALTLRGVVTAVLEEMGRLTRGLHPTALDDLGLAAALERQTRDHAALFALEVESDLAGLQGIRLPREVETTLYRIAQEALTNVSRHARASRATLLVCRDAQGVELTVTDDGTGFDVPAALAAARRSGCLGLTSIRERAALLGGTAAFLSAPGQGTSVRVRLPLVEVNP